MKFNNRENKSYKINDKIVWESRSVAVNCVILAMIQSENYEYDTYVLVSKRGPNAADFQGKMNVIAGYLDWDETGTEACLREGWEECGINIKNILDSSHFPNDNDSPIIISNDMEQPWHVNTDPNSNRQNVSLRYGMKVILNGLPKLTTDYNEVLGEVEDPLWLNINYIDNFDWAFNHDKLIKEYLKYVK